MSLALVSLNPRIPGDMNIRLAPGRGLTQKQIQALARARAILVPQSIDKDSWAFLHGLGHPLFPEYTNRFEFSGKAGNHALFKKFHLPHPETRMYGSVSAFRKIHPHLDSMPFSWPLVVKADHGGCGNAVFLAQDPEGLETALSRLGPDERFIVQEFIPHNGSDLRVVIVGQEFFAYWRTQKDPGEFRNNVGKGASIILGREPDLTQKGVACVKQLSKKTGINLAAVDVLFDRTKKDPAPLLSEINYCFGRKGLGGSERFSFLLKEAVTQWTRSL